MKDGVAEANPAAQSAAQPSKSTFPPSAAIPTQHGEKGVRFDFNLGARVLLPARAEGKWRVLLRDLETGNILFQSDNQGASVSSSKRYYVRFGIDVWELDDAGTATSVLHHEHDVRGREVLIQFPVGTLGDILAWFPYAARFGQVHGCKLTCALSGLIIPLLKDAYPDIRLVTHEELKEQKLEETFYATYSLGLFFDDAANIWQPTDFRHVGLHRTAGYILGVDPTEEPARVVLADDSRPIDEPYVCIAAQTSMQPKYWNNPHGWRQVVAFLKEQGFRVICIDQKSVHGTGLVWNHIPYGAEDQTGDRSLLERARWLKHAHAFVGLSSGLAWLAWAMRVPVVLISGFTHPNNEFFTPYRVINWHACNSCWNDVRHRFDHKDFIWCPRHKDTPRQYECTRLITAEQVINTLKRLPAPHTRAAPVELPETYDDRHRWYDAETPEISVIVLNFNKAELTRACVESLWRHTSGRRYEIVVVDNGSRAEEIDPLARLGTHIRLIRLSVNRFFGEGNNIGFEASRGRYVVFMNNDVTVKPGWLPPLIERLESDPSVGGVGPKMIYPDGRLQEAGAMMAANGLESRIGNGQSPDAPEFNQERTVDYVSAATFAMRREDFERVLGFDLTWEPAYFEDVDLCLKLRQLGLSTVYCPASVVVHHEKGTSKETFQQQTLDAIIEHNRYKFTTKWHAVLAGKADIAALPAPPAIVPLAAPADARRAILYTPYNLLPGGGERYLLTIAQHLSKQWEVTLATAETYSRLRLLTLARELSLDLSRVRIARLDQATAAGDYDLGIVLGIHVLPPIKGPAKRNIYICQFPFPASQREIDDGFKHVGSYGEVFVYSDYVRRHLLARTGRIKPAYPPVRVVAPPLQLWGASPSRRNLAAKAPIILGVGRFFVGGHNKRHDVMIAAFRELRQMVDGPLDLHLAGSLHPDLNCHDYFRQLVQLAQGLSVTFHPNIAPDRLKALYDSAFVYWHAAGFEVDEAKTPERCEHFGITVVEAMSARCIPIVVDRGGPADIVTPGKTGFHYRDRGQLVEMTKRVLDNRDQAWVKEMQLAAMKKASQFGERHFDAALDKVLLAATEDVG